jgi:hypothetical protein
MTRLLLNAEGRQRACPWRHGAEPARWACTLYFAPRPGSCPADSFIPLTSHAPLTEARGAASGAVGGDAVALTAFVAPHRPPEPVLDAS